MKIPNPNNPIFVQKNNGERDANANIAGSWNCDFSRYPGKVMASPRLIQNTTITDDADLTKINALVEFDANYWGVGEDYTWLNARPIDGSFSQDGNINAPTNCDTDSSDMVVFDGAVLVSTLSNIDRRDDYTNNWTNNWYSGLTGGATMTSGIPHPMEVLRIGSPLLAIGNGNELNTVQGSGTYTATDPRLTLDSSQQIRWIRSGTSRCFIGTTYNGEDGNGLVYEWDGGDTVPTRQYIVNALGTMAAAVLDDTLYVVTTNGELQRLQGGGFVTVAKFPFTDTYLKLNQYDADYDPSSLHQRGMVANRGKLLINISTNYNTTTSNGGYYLEYCPSGIWEFDPRTNRLSHKYSFTADKTGAKDMGQWAVPDSAQKGPGAVIPINTTRAYSVLASGSFYPDNGESTATSEPALYVDDHAGSTKRRMRIWSNQIFTPDTSSLFQTIALKYVKMKNANDKILVKYRTEKDANYPMTGSVTWSDTDTFTTTADFSNVKAGDEVFVVCGYGGGSSAHVSSISEAAGTYTINLDEAVYGVSASDTSTVAVENWTKLDSFNDQLLTYKEMNLPTPASSWIQVLVELRSDGGDSPILEEIDIIPTKHR